MLSVVDEIFNIDIIKGVQLKSKWTCVCVCVISERAYNKIFQGGGQLFNS